MKRVTILVDDIGEPDDFDGERRLVGARCPDFGQDCWVAADRIISIEDHVEPLPTEPGTRFWGQLGDDAPQWWFIREPHISDGMQYMPMRGVGLFVEDAEARGLVRLSDPEPTETDGAR